MSRRVPPTVSPNLSRRHLIVFGSTSLAMSLVACKGEKNQRTSGTKSTNATKGCSAPIDATSKQMRSTLKYADSTADPAKACDKCVQFVAGAFGDCGSCKLFSGPVQPKGTCASFAPNAATSE